MNKYEKEIVVKLVQKEYDKQMKEVENYLLPKIEEQTNKILKEQFTTEFGKDARRYEEIEKTLKELEEEKDKLLNQMNETIIFGEEFHHNRYGGSLIDHYHRLVAEEARKRVLNAFPETKEKLETLVAKRADAWDTIMMIDSKRVIVEAINKINEELGLSLKI